jgi:serine/threonine-protein kinase RsbT
VSEVLAQETWCVDGESVVTAVQQRAKDLAFSLGMGPRASEAVTIAVSELAYNIAVHAGRGEVVLQTVREEGRYGIVAIARDHGPGIADLEWALTDGCSSTGGLGSGLPAVRRLMDEFDIDARVGQGTVVTVKKWSEPTNKG